MFFENFTILVAVLALCYAFLARYLQNRLIDRSKMEEIQKESKMLSEELKKAQQSKNQKKIDEAMQKQMELFPKMNSMMFAQMKPMFIILGILFAFIWVADQINPFTKDDIILTLTDDGNGCDMLAGDGIFTACHTPQDMNYGKWTVSAKAYENGAEVSSNETYFLYNPDYAEDTYSEMGKGEGMALDTDRKEYYPGDTVKITAVPVNMTKGVNFIIPILPPRELHVDLVRATLSNGTYFRAELPVTIPLLNVKNIYQPYWWFILVSLITNLSISFVTGRIKKVKK